MDILTLKHIVRLTMFSECGISTQKWPEIREKGQRWSPEIVSRCPEIVSWFPNYISRSSEIVSRFPQNVSWFHENISRFHKIVSPFPKIVSWFPEIVSPFLESETRYSFSCCNLYDEKVLGILWKVFVYVYLSLFSFLSLTLLFSPSHYFSFSLCSMHFLGSVKGTFKLNSWFF